MWPSSEMTGIRNISSFAGKKMGQQRGWVLVDAIIAFAIVATALLAIIVVYTYSARMATAAKTYQTAVYLAQQQLEILRQYDGTADIKKLATSITDPLKYQVGKVENTVRIRTVTADATLPARIIPYQVSVEWTDPGSAQTVKNIEIVNYYYSN